MKISRVNLLLSLLLILTLSICSHVAVANNPKEDPARLEKLNRVTICLPKSDLPTDGPQSKMTDGIGNFSLKDIPVGNFELPFIMPEKKKPAETRITQHYNTSEADGFCLIQNKKFPAEDSICAGLPVEENPETQEKYCLVKKYVYNNPYDPHCSKSDRWYGHNGTDFHSGGTRERVPVYAIQDGLVVVSQRNTKKQGWGETIIIATRPNKYSEEILTFHYHHFHASDEGPEGYFTTRKVLACEKVTRGETQLGLEGETGNTGGIHLHLTIRRWNNIQELKAALKEVPRDELNPHPLYGWGYTKGDITKLDKHIHPEELLFDTFADGLKGQGPPSSAETYAKVMRRLGIEFGHPDGRFGFHEEVSRTLSAKWVKIAAKQLTRDYVFQQAFNDVNRSHLAFPYVEALARYPENNPVINPESTCGSEPKMFCPDATRPRAEALKMVVAAFYNERYLSDYTGWFSFTKHNYWNDHPEFFQDSRDAWYSSYVYFASDVGLIPKEENFKPHNKVTRGQMAEWLMKAHEDKYGSGTIPCDRIACLRREFCNVHTTMCEPLDQCIPSEVQFCNIGGSIPTECENPACTPGESQTRSCGTNGTQFSTCNASCQWEPWSACDEGCVCSSGQCCDGCQFLPKGMLCNNGYNYRCQGPNSGQDLEQSYHAVYCSGFEAECTVEANSPWSVLYDCSSNEVCDISIRGCAPLGSQCSASSYWSLFSASDTDPTGVQFDRVIDASLRVEVQEEGTVLQARVCRASGTFMYDIAFSIYDAATDSTIGAARDSLATTGESCSPWVNVANAGDYREGQMFGGTWQVVSPASSREDWDFPWSGCTVRGNPGGTCWNGYGISLTRTCR